MRSFLGVLDVLSHLPSPQHSRGRNSFPRSAEEETEAPRRGEVVCPKLERVELESGPASPASDSSTERQALQGHVAQGAAGPMYGVLDDGWTQMDRWMDR